MNEMQTERRSVIKKIIASTVGFLSLGVFADVKAKVGSTEVGSDSLVNYQGSPLFSRYKRHGDKVYIAGKGAHVAPFEIKAHTEIVLTALEKELIAAGSSMEKVLKVTVYLDNIEDFDGMNQIFKGRFGNNPPVRSTVAVAKGGVPGNSLVEMDCVAYI